ncbi:hypothetical protein TNIN_27711 [Trichonephila inaurata madagascariensis]|uniref:Uncharacterized protein n=1 Tax=Trichonephila inaurata madagascariensis TaxID=2747483 RepID=A0A8X6YHM7_9ARAC|nr:hypothetical protein TNIN_27711 [Trichonephila inaurata madagascariensis]
MGKDGRRKESAKTPHHSRKRSREGGAGTDQWHTAPPTAARQRGKKRGSSLRHHLQVMTVGHGPRRETEKASVRRASLRYLLSVTFRRPNKCVFSQARFRPPKKDAPESNTMNLAFF